MTSLVIVESPYAGNIETNLKYARAACKDCLNRGETPYASHLFFPQMLDEDDPDEREWGVRAGYDWGRAAIKAAVADSGDTHPIFTLLVVFYVDRGWSPGMEVALGFYSERGVRCEMRYLSDWSPDNPNP